MPSYKQVGFDLTLIEDTYGQFNIVSIDGAPFAVDYNNLQNITNWPNQGVIVEATLPGEDGDTWLKQTIEDYSTTPPNQIIMVISDVNENEFNVASWDFIGGRPPRRPGS